MGKKHLVIFLGGGYAIYSGITTAKYFAENPKGYIINLLGILGVTLFILWSIYLGEK